MCNGWQVSRLAWSSCHSTDRGRIAGRDDFTRKHRAKLEYPACVVCGSDRREFPFRLHDPYNIARCTTCGFCYLYPRIIASAMQEAYRQPSYYEGVACGYADTSYATQEFALRATFKRLLHNLADRRLTGGALLEVGCGYGYLLDEARPYFDCRVGTEFSQKAQKSPAQRTQKFLLEASNRFPRNVSSIASSRFR